MQFISFALNRLLSESNQSSSSLIVVQKDDQKTKPTTKPDLIAVVKNKKLMESKQLKPLIRLLEDVLMWIKETKIKTPNQKAIKKLRNNQIKQTSQKNVINKS
jgi:hypothetical protein